MEEHENVTHDFLIGRWRIKHWVSKQIIHSPEENLDAIRAIDGILEEDFEEKTYNVWEDDRSTVYDQVFLQSFKTDAAMADYVLEFTSEKDIGRWHLLKVWNDTEGNMIKKGYWMMEDRFPNAIDLSVWDYNLPLNVKILSQQQLLLKETFAGDETDSYTHEITLERI